LSYSPWAIPAFVRGINISAEFNLGFTEPFSRLGFKLQALVEDAKDMQSLSYAFAHLGEGLAKDSPFLAPVETYRFRVLSNAAFLDWMIASKSALGQSALAQSASVQSASAQPALAKSASAESALGKAASAESALAQSASDLRTTNAQTKAQLAKEATWVSETLPPGVPSRCLDNLRQILRNQQPSVAMSAVHEQQACQTLLHFKAQDLYRKLWRESNPELVAKLQNSDPWVRWLAATAIGRKGIHVEKELIQLLNDPFAQVREAAHQALVRLARGTDFGPLVADPQPKIQQAMKRWEERLALHETVSSTVGQLPAAAPAKPNPGDLQPRIIEIPDYRQVMRAFLQTWRR